MYWNWTPRFSFVVAICLTVLSFELKHTDRPTGRQAVLRSPQTLNSHRVTSSALEPRPTEAMGQSARSFRSAIGGPTATQAVVGNRLNLSYLRLPLSFEANVGQTDSPVDFLSRGRGYSVLLTPHEAVLRMRKPLARGAAWSAFPNPIIGSELKRVGPATLSLLPRSASRLPTRYSSPFPAIDVATQATTVVALKLIGATQYGGGVGLEELPAKSNYFIGNEPKKWRTNVANYARVKYEGVYPGIDLVYYGNQRELEFDFVVAPGTDPRAIRLAIVSDEGADTQQQAETSAREGPDRAVAGQSTVGNRRSSTSARHHLDANGDLVVELDGGEVRFHKPVVYQPVVRRDDGAGRRYLAGRYVLRGENEIGFELRAFDKSRPVIIDPVLTYSTYLGGSTSNFGFAIAVDSSGNAYVTGATDSTDFPTANAYQSQCGDCSGEGASSAFVSKFNSAGSALIYSTYVGGTMGSNGDGGTGIAVDATGHAYVTGIISATDFPTTANAYQAANAGGHDGFVTKLNPKGSALVYSTYLGGSGDDGANGIAIDLAGNAYVTGGTDSADFPLEVPFQTAPGGTFVTKLNPSGSELAYSTYLGGSGGVGKGIALEPFSGSAYVTGSTSSTNFPTVNPFQPKLGSKTAGDCLISACSSVFVTRFNFQGTALIYSTYLGGSGSEGGAAIAVDDAGSAYVTGGTTSPDFPTASPYQAKCAGCPKRSAAFVAKFDPAGSALVYSTYLGGSGSTAGGDSGSGIAVDDSGNAYITGLTQSADFPTANAVQGAYAGIADAFVTKLNPTGSALVFSTYLGGSDYDVGFGIAVDVCSNAYITGNTQSTDFPTEKPFQAKQLSDILGDAFVAKIATLSGPCILVDPRLVIFPLQLVGTVSPPHLVKLANDSGQPILIRRISTSREFFQTNNCGREVAVGSGCTIKVTFNPFVAHEKIRGVLTIKGNSSRGLEQRVLLVGRSR
jgi:Beta-propeller repeat